MMPPRNGGTLLLGRGTVNKPPCPPVQRPVKASVGPQSGAFTPSASRNQRYSAISFLVRLLHKAGETHRVALRGGGFVLVTQIGGKQAPNPVRVYDCRHLGLLEFENANPRPR
jgi:hypothetical protein